MSVYVIWVYLSFACANLGWCAHIPMVGRWQNQCLRKFSGLCHFCLSGKKSTTHPAGLQKQTNTGQKILGFHEYKRERLEPFSLQLHGNVCFRRLLIPGEPGSPGGLASGFASAQILSFSSDFCWQVPRNWQNLAMCSAICVMTKAFSPKALFPHSLSPWVFPVVERMCWAIRWEDLSHIVDQVMCFTFRGWYGNWSLRSCYFCPGSIISFMFLIISLLRKYFS